MELKLKLKFIFKFYIFTSNPYKYVYVYIHNNIFDMYIMYVIIYRHNINLQITHCIFTYV